MSVMLVGIATSADSPPRLRGKVVELDRFSAQVALETREPALRQGASVWLHFDPPGGGSPLSVGGIISGVARGGRITVLLSLSPREYSRLRGLPEPPVQRGRRAVQPSTLPGIRPIRKPEAPEPRPEPGSSRPGQPVEAPAAVEAGGEPEWLRSTEEAEAPVEAVEPPPEPASVSPREQAEALIGRGDLQGAWKVYYDALRVEPDDLRLWYGLGLTLSRLDRWKEAEEIFRYVVSRGDPDSEEMKHALHWLVSAASLAKAAAPAVPAAPRGETEPWAVITGKVTWKEPEPPREAFLVLQGLDKDAPRAHTRVRLGESYEFDRLPPGSYHLVGGVENDWLWDLRCTLEAGQEMVLDLSKQNSTNPKARI